MRKVPDKPIVLGGGPPALVEPEAPQLDAINVQRVVQGLLDAWRELSMEHGRMRRATHWGIVNEGLAAGERLNEELKRKLQELHLPVTESRSKP